MLWDREPFQTDRRPARVHDEGLEGVEKGQMIHHDDDARTEHYPDVVQFLLYYKKPIPRQISP